MTIDVETRDGVPVVVGSNQAIRRAEARVAPKITAKRYECTRCGHVVNQSTNHHGATWSWGRVNTCPSCPPWAKYPEFGGATIWRCIDDPDPGQEDQIKALTPKKKEKKEATRGKR